MASSMSTTLSEPEFERLADEELRHLIGALDEASDDLEADLQMGVLSIVFDDGTKYVVNSHRAARQIWMAAEKRAWHFDYDGERWLAAASGDELRSTLSAGLARKLGAPLSLG